MNAFWGIFVLAVFTCGPAQGYQAKPDIMAVVNCFKGWMDQTGDCKVPQPTRDCINAVHMQDGEGESIKESLLEALDGPRTLCPAAVARGSCFKAEKAACERGLDMTECPTVDHAKSCLLGLKQECNTTEADQKINDRLYAFYCDIWGGASPCDDWTVSSCISNNVDLNLVDGLWRYNCTTQSIGAARTCFSNLKQHCTKPWQLADLDKRIGDLGFLCHEP